jgi:hypothetical protein
MGVCWRRGYLLIEMKDLVFKVFKSSDESVGILEISFQFILQYYLPRFIFEIDRKTYLVLHRLP